MTKNAAGKLTLAFILAALMAPIGNAVAQSARTQPTVTSGTDPEPTVTSGTDPEPTVTSGTDLEPDVTSGTDPEPTVVETILALLNLS